MSPAKEREALELVYKELQRIGSSSPPWWKAPAFWGPLMINMLIGLVMLAVLWANVQNQEKELDRLRSEFRNHELDRNIHGHALRNDLHGMRVTP